MARELTKKERLAIPRNPMPAQDPTERICNFDEVALGYTEDLAIGESLALEDKGLDGLALGGGLKYRFSSYEARLDYTYRHFGPLGSINVFTVGFAVR